MFFDLHPACEYADRQCVWCAWYTGYIHGQPGGHTKHGCRSSLHNDRRNPGCHPDGHSPPAHSHVYKYTCAHVHSNQSSYHHTRTHQSKSIYSFTEHIYVCPALDQPNRVGQHLRGRPQHQIHCPGRASPSLEVCHAMVSAAGQIQRSSYRLGRRRDLKR